MSLLSPTTVERARELRRAIHRFPEPGFGEERTAALVEHELDELGLEHWRLARTGVVAVVRGVRQGVTVALRADMDALPLQERSGEAFSSEVAGMMHACGHDAHTAMLLGAARELVAGRDALAGTVVLVFQPAEEGPGGALPMIEAGVLDEPRVEAMAMLHVDLRIPTGTIGIAGGSVNAAADELHVTIEGRGGHGASPHTAIDAIPCAAATVLALQNVTARETDPLASVVVTIGTIEGGYRNNIIADRVAMTGTLRSHDPEIRKGLEARVRRIAEGVASAYGARATVEVLYGYPPVVNDTELAAAFAQTIRERAPDIAVVQTAPTMGGEDFAYFAERVPALLIRLGIRNEAAGCIHPLHGAQFRLDEGALAVGIRTLVTFARAAGAGDIPKERKI